MRVTLALVILVLALLAACTQRGPKASATTTVSQRPTAPATTIQIASADTPAAKIDFATQVKPILAARCQPCHFEGGKMYERLPFDQPKTIISLGTRLFTRIKDENEQRLIREFLAQQ